MLRNLIQPVFLILIIVLVLLALLTSCESGVRRITVIPGTPILISKATLTEGYVLNSQGQLEGPYKLVLPEGYTAAPYDWGR